MILLVSFFLFGPELEESQELSSHLIYPISDHLMVTPYCLYIKFTISYWSLRYILRQTRKVSSSLRVHLPIVRLLSCIRFRPSTLYSPTHDPYYSSDHLEINPVKESLYSLLVLCNFLFF